MKNWHSLFNRSPQQLRAMVLPICVSHRLAAISPRAPTTLKPVTDALLRCSSLTPARSEINHHLRLLQRNVELTDTKKKKFKGVLIPLWIAITLNTGLRVLDFIRHTPTKVIWISNSSTRIVSVSSRPSIIFFFSGQELWRVGGELVRRTGEVARGLNNLPLIYSVVLSPARVFRLASRPYHRLLCVF